MAFPPVLSILGTALGAAKSFADSQAQAKQARYAANLLNLQARNQVNSANSEANKIRRQSDIASGASRARDAGSGLLLDGSPSDAINQNAAYAHLDAMNALWRGQSQAHDLQAQAAAKRAAAKSAEMDGYFGLGNGVLQGLGGLNGLTGRGSQGLAGIAGAGARASANAGGQLSDDDLRYFRQFAP